MSRPDIEGMREWIRLAKGKVPAPPMTGEQFRALLDYVAELEGVLLAVSETDRGALRELSCFGIEVSPENMDIVQKVQSVVRHFEPGAPK